MPPSGTVCVFCTHLQVRFPARKNKDIYLWRQWTCFKLLDLSQSPEKFGEILLKGMYLLRHLVPSLFAAQPSFVCQPEHQISFFFPETPQFPRFPAFQWFYSFPLNKRELSLRKLEKLTVFWCLQLAEKWTTNEDVYIILTGGGSLVTASFGRLWPQFLVACDRMNCYDVTFLGRRQYLVMLVCHFSWQAHYLVMLEGQFLWQAQRLVKFG